VPDLSKKRTLFKEGTVYYTRNILKPLTIPFVLEIISPKEDRQPLNTLHAFLDFVGGGSICYNSGAMSSNRVV